MTMKTPDPFVSPAKSAVGFFPCAEPSRPQRRKVTTKGARGAKAEKAIHVWFQYIFCLLRCLWPFFFFLCGVRVWFDFASTAFDGPVQVCGLTLMRCRRTHRNPLDADGG